MSRMDIQNRHSESSFLGFILIFSITIVTGMIFIPELQSSPDNTFYNINDAAESKITLADGTLNNTETLYDK